MNELNDESLPNGALISFIKTQVIDAYETDGIGLFLSDLGGRLSAQTNAHLREALKGKKLAEFIKDEMADTIRIVPYPMDNKVKLALPVSAPEDSGDPMRFFQKKNTTNHPEGMPRYNHALWAAFSLPLNNDCIRLIGFDPKIHFEDICNNTPTASTPTKKEVQRRFIVDPSLESNQVLRAQKIAENIRRWLRENSVNVDLVEAKGFDVKGSSGAHKDSVLEILISVLDEADLKRIQIPLDLVAKLHRKR